MEKRLEENKKVNQQVEQKLHNMTPTSLKNKQEEAPQGESKKKVEKIVNFDQSFEPEFKPE